MSILKKKINSNASRNLYFSKFQYKLLRNWVRLHTKLKGHFAASYTGRKLLFRRSRVSKNIKFLKCNHSRYFSSLPSTVAGFINTKPANRSTIILLQSSGLYFFKNLSNWELFYFHFSNKLMIYPELSGVVYTFYLGYVNINSYVHLVQDIFSSCSAYAKSLGSFALVLSRGVEYTFFILELPSKYKKLFFILTPVDLYFEDQLVFPVKSQKAGFYRRNGRRPKVRGVAMNPVDHPHGGRTKSIRLQKSPWGWNTKL